MNFIKEIGLNKKEKLVTVIMLMIATLAFFIPLVFSLGMMNTLNTGVAVLGIVLFLIVVLGITIAINAIFVKFQWMKIDNDAKLISSTLVSNSLKINSIVILAAIIYYIVAIILAIVAYTTSIILYSIVALVFGVGAVFLFLYLMLVGFFVVFDSSKNKYQTSKLTYSTFVSLYKSSFKKIFSELLLFLLVYIIFNFLSAFIMILTSYNAVGVLKISVNIVISLFTTVGNLWLFISLVIAASKKVLNI